MPRKKKTPVVTPAIDLPKEFLEKLIPGPMDAAGVEAVFQQLKKAVIERALDVVLEGRTAIVIAHRLATAMRADRIAVVGEGRVLEVGSHSELVAAGGRYAAMYRSWAAHA